MKKLFIITVIACAMIVCSCTQKKEPTSAFPNKEITVICPWSKGGGTDAILRAICTAAEKQLGQPIVVENKTGAGSAIGHTAIKDAAPDGYTLGMITFEVNTLPQQGLIDFTYADYDLLTRVNADAATLTVKADAPYNSVQEFVDYCKAHPGQVSIGNSTTGSVWHIGAGLFAKRTGIDVKHVPFEGASGAVSALVSGTIDAVSVSLAEVKTQLDAGNVKVIGIMDTKAPVAYPNIKTFIEQGFDITYYTWRGLAVPKGVDPAIKQILVDAFTKAEEDPEFIKTAQELNLSLAYMAPEEFGAFLKQNYEEVSATMQDLGLTK